MINFKNKNNTILMISAILIVIAIIITCIATAVEHGKKKGTDTTNTSAPGVSASETIASTDKLDGKVAGTYIVNTESSDLNIRNRPDGSPVEKAPKGAKITVKAVYGEWGYVEYNGVGGWVAMQYTKLLTPSKEAPAHKTGKYTIATESTPLGIRSTPSYDGARLSQIDKGTEVEILAVVDEWGYVEYNGYKGWLPFEYLK